MARPPSKTLRSTPLRAWRERHPEKSWEELAREADLSIATVKRAAAGTPIDEASAAALERVTGVPASKLCASSGAPSKPAKTPKPATAPKPTGRRTGSGPKQKATTKDPATRAAILVLAELVGDERAAAENDVSDRSLRRWRAELPTDPALARAYAKRLDGGWSRKLQALVEVVAGAAIKLVQSPDLTIDNLRDLGSILDTTAGLLVDREALSRRAGARNEDGEDESSTDREGETYRADRPGPRPFTAH